MKRTPPTTDHLSRIYYELAQIGARSVGAKKPWPHHPASPEALLALAADFSRHDPRLLEVLVQYGLEHWRELQPQKLRTAMMEMETPQTFGVVAAFLETAHPGDQEMNLFWRYVTQGLKPVSPQFYFGDLHPPASHLAEQTAKESLSEFKAWGFLGRDRVIVDAGTKKTAGTWDLASRLNILRRLLKRKKRIQISDYLAALEHTLSRQQALLDFKSLKAKPHGEGRSASWSL